jgi:type II secretory pathway pseudopilin PulG
MSPTGTSSRESGVQALRRSGVRGNRPECLNARTPERLIPGFTLVELIVVLICLIVMAVAVVPALRGAGHQEDLNSAAMRVAAAARLGRDTAVEQQVPIDLMLESQPPAVRLVPAEETTGPTTQSAPAVPSAMGRGTTTGSPILPSRIANVLLPARVTAHMEAAPEDPASSVSSTSSNSRAGAQNETGLRFPPDGRTVGGMVVLSDDHGHVQRVLITPQTGIVRIEEGGS